MKRTTPTIKLKNFVINPQQVITAMTSILSWT
jgi:hypothetical protein